MQTIKFVLVVSLFSIDFSYLRKMHKRKCTKCCKQLKCTLTYTQCKCACVCVWVKRVRACRKLSGLFVLCGLHSFTIHMHRKEINKYTHTHTRTHLCIYEHAPVCVCMRFLPQLRPGLHSPRTHHKQLQRRWFIDFSLLSTGFNSAII